MTTGYSEERAAPHEAAVDRMIGELFDRGYMVFEQGVDGHRPDTRLTTGEYVEVKTGSPNLTIELNSLQTYRQIEIVENTRVYIVWIKSPESPVADWVICTPDSLTAGIINGPNRRSGTGSRDDWYLSNPKGIRFVDFFRSVQP